MSDQSLTVHQGGIKNGFEKLCMLRCHPMIELVRIKGPLNVKVGSAEVHDPTIHE
jgi:hypothetical protein